jgi:hypothetical protein
LSIVFSFADATCIVSRTEIQLDVRPYGAIDPYLYQALLNLSNLLAPFNFNTGETWTLGDSALVLLTALTDKTATASSAFALMPAPHLKSDGTYSPGSGRLLLRT